MIDILNNVDTWISRFLDKIEITNNCWLWRACTGRSNGYELFKLNGKLYAAHRVSFNLYIGPIPDDLVVMHTCDNPLCVNPGHLKLGSIKENNYDKINKGRANMPKGENHYTKRWLK